jgi:hypothetical protein
MTHISGKWKVIKCSDVFNNYENDKSNICDVTNNKMAHCEHIVLYGD